MGHSKTEKIFIGNIVYKIWYTRTAMVYGVCGDDSEVIIPPIITYKGINYDVISIRSYAFNGCENLTSITLPDSITYIGDEIFMNCNNLKEITFEGDINLLKNEYRKKVKKSNYKPPTWSELLNQNPIYHVLYNN